MSAPVTTAHYLTEPERLIVFRKGVGRVLSTSVLNEPDVETHVLELLTAHGLVPVSRPRQNSHGFTVKVR